MHHGQQILATSVQRVSIQIGKLTEILATLSTLMLPLVMAHGALMGAQIGPEIAKS